MRVNAGMQTDLESTRLPARARAIAESAPSPLTLLFGSGSLVITLLVVIGTVVHGRVSSSGPLELICAIVLAAVAATDASRPGRRERSRRQIRRAG
jgi:hypothetical protein